MRVMVLEQPPAPSKGSALKAGRLLGGECALGLVVLLNCRIDDAEGVEARGGMCALASLSQGTVEVGGGSDSVGGLVRYARLAELCVRDTLVVGERDARWYYES